ncbi:MAG TPA: hypothetical protein VEB22_05415 [Phycisphaerales bacterium]|nr:hypothetical protein [Phycisphaerales bacterium]
MGPQTAKVARRRGRLWAAAAVGFLLAAAAAAALITPWKPSVSGGGLVYTLAWIDSTGALREGPIPAGETARAIDVDVTLSAALRGENAVWRKIAVELRAGSKPIPGPLVPGAASIAREYDFRTSIRVPIAPHDIPWEQVMAGQPYSWIEPGWPEVRRIAAISATVGLAAGAAAFGLAALVQSRLRRTGRCARCGYELAGLPEGTACPECGLTAL